MSTLFRSNRFGARSREHDCTRDSRCLSSHSSRRPWPLVEPMVQLEANHDAGSDDTDTTYPCSELRALAELIEPAAALVSSTARGDPALALVADPTAAGSASQAAALASERLERMASTLAALPLTQRYPPRRYHDARPRNTLSKSSPEVRTPPPTTSRKPLIIEIVDEDVTPSTPEDEKAAQPATSTSGREDEYLSIASVAALAAAAYVSGAELHGVDALPGWSSPSAATAARALLQRAFGSETERARSDTLDEQARENLARCLGESAPVLAHCLACAPEPRWGAEPEEDDRREPRPPAPELPRSLRKRRNWRRLNLPSSLLRGFDGSSRWWDTLGLAALKVWYPVSRPVCFERWIIKTLQCAERAALPSSLSSLPSLVPSCVGTALPFWTPRRLRSRRPRQRSSGQPQRHM